MVKIKRYTLAFIGWVIAFPLFAQSAIQAPIGGVSVNPPIEIHRISSLVEDKDGIIWFGTTGNGLFKFDGVNYLQYLNADNSALLSPYITSLCLDSKERMWIGTQKGVNRKNIDENFFSVVPINESNGYVIKLFEDSFKRIFVATQVSLLRYDEEDGVFSKVISFDSNNLNDIYVDDNGEIWIIYSNSIVQYDRNYTYIKTYNLPSPVFMSAFDDIKTIFLNSVAGIYCFDINSRRVVAAPDKLKEISKSGFSLMTRIGDNLLAFVSEGMHYCYLPLSGKLLNETNKDFPYDVVRNIGTLSNIVSGRNGNIWAITGDNKIVSLQTNLTSPYRALLRELQGADIRGLTYDNKYVRCIMDSRYIVTYDVVSGILSKQDLSSIVGDANMMRRTNIQYDKKSGRILLYNSYGIIEIEMDDSFHYSVFRSAKTKTFPYLLSATVDGKNTVWASFLDDPYLYIAEYNDNNSIFEFVRTEILPQSPRVYPSKLLTLSNGDVIAGYTDIGLLRIGCIDGKVSHINLSDKYKQMYIQTMCEDNNGKIWVGTSDVGLFIYDPAQDSVVAPVEFDGKNIHNIAKATDGTVLFYTSSTIYKYDENDKSFSPVWKSMINPNENGTIYPLPYDYCLIKTGTNLSLIAKDGEPSHNKSDFYSIIVSDHNSNVLAQIRSEELESQRNKIWLSSNYADLNIIVSVPNYYNSQYVFRYKIGRQTKGWEESFSEPTIELNRVSYGRHSVKLQLINLGSNEERELPTFDIIIKRPWYISILALAFYVVFVVAMTVILLRMLYTKQRKELEADHLRMEKEAQERLNQSNVDFFVNLSHEFRTPLSLIFGAARTFDNNDDISASQQRLLKIIQRNSDRMLKLVSQMLDFNKLEHGKLQLHVARTDVNAVIGDIVSLLSFGASEKGVDLKVEGIETPLEIWLDVDKFEKIMYNLLSNALKFTPPFKGKVSVLPSVVSSSEIAETFSVGTQTLNNGTYLMMTISDNGIGIPEDSLTLIFERFGQAHNANKSGGTGIGLFFAKSLVELHHGYIKAENNNGAVFTFAIPMSDDAYSEAEKSAPQESVASKVIDSNRYINSFKQSDKSENVDKLKTVLVIDDDYELVYFLKSILSPKYRVVTSFNAMTGYKLIESEHPDLIISDIMMVEMDGLQLCRMVKENIDMCHIPFILLTAKDTVASQIEGFNVGAEGYIVKPFDPDHLIATVGSLLRNREILKHILGNVTQVENKMESSISGRDKQFLDKLFELFEENITNPEINIGDFAEELSISRTKMFYKVKELTGMTPNDYFNLYKLNRSIEYLKEDRYKISVIADMCGFSSPSHYAVLFKKQFGVLPSEYLDTL